MASERSRFNTRVSRFCFKNGAREKASSHPPKTNEVFTCQVIVPGFAETVKLESTRTGRWGRPLGPHVRVTAVQSFTQTAAATTHKGHPTEALHTGFPRARVGGTASRVHTPVPRTPVQGKGPNLSQAIPRGSAGDRRGFRGGRCVGDRPSIPPPSCAARGRPGKCCGELTGPPQPPPFLHPESGKGRLCSESATAALPLRLRPAQPLGPSAGQVGR